MKNALNHEVAKNTFHAYVIDRYGKEQHISFLTYGRYLRFEFDCRADGVLIARFVVDPVA